MADTGVPNRRRLSSTARVALGLLILATGFGGVRVYKYRHPAYVGTTVEATLAWGCVNDIYWKGTRGPTWWAGSEPAPKGTLDTLPVAADANPPRHFAEGTLLFRSFNRAVFTSDAGGTLTLKRQPNNVKYVANCVLGFKDPR